MDIKVKNIKRQFTDEVYFIKRAVLLLFFKNGF